MKIDRRWPCGCFDILELDRVPVRVWCSKGDDICGRVREDDARRNKETTMKTEKMTEDDKKNVRLFAKLLMLFGSAGLAGVVWGARTGVAVFCAYWVTMGAIALWELRE